MIVTINFSGDEEERDGRVGADFKMVKLSFLYFQSPTTITISLPSFCCLSADFIVALHPLLGKYSSRMTSCSDEKEKKIVAVWNYVQDISPGQLSN